VKCHTITPHRHHIIHSACFPPLAVLISDPWPRSWCLHNSLVLWVRGLVRFSMVLN
jgi:hypothetical protein